MPTEDYKYTEYGLDKLNFEVLKMKIRERWEKDGLLDIKDFKKLYKLGIKLMTHNYDTYHTYEF